MAGPVKIHHVKKDPRLPSGGAINLVGKSQSDQTIANSSSFISTPPLFTTPSLLQNLNNWVLKSRIHGFNY